VVWNADGWGGKVVAAEQDPCYVLVLSEYTRLSTNLETFPEYLGMFRSMVPFEFILVSRTERLLV
jgi:hypothetical protein